MSGYEFVQRGKVLIVKKQYQDAVKVCRLGLLAHPTLVEGRLVLGMALMALGRFDEVLAEMRVALELDKASPLGHLLKGEALFRKGDHRQAAEVLARAKELDPLNEKVTSLLEEVRRAKEAGGKAGRGLAPPSASFSEPTETKAYPAHRGAALPDVSPDRSERREDPPSGAVTMPVTPGAALPKPPQPAKPTPKEPSTIELASHDGVITEDQDATEISDSQVILSGGSMVTSPSVVEIASSDMEELSDPAIIVGQKPPGVRTPGQNVVKRGGPAPARADEQGTRQVAPAPADLQATIDELDAENADDYELVDLAATGSHARSGAIDSVEELIEPDDYEEGDGGDDYDEGRERSRRIARALSALPARGAEPPLKTRPPFRDGPTNPETPGASRRGGGVAAPGEQTATAVPRGAAHGHREAAAQSQAPARKPLFVDDEELESTEPSSVEVQPRRPLPSVSERPSRRGLPAQPAPPVAPPRAPPKPAPRPSQARPAAPPPVSAMTSPPTPTAGVSSDRRARSEVTGRTTGERARALALKLPKRGPSAVYLALIAVVVVVVAIGAGLAVRETRLKRRMRAMTRDASAAAADQTFRGYAQAQAYYQAILQERDDPAAKAALARVQAAVAAELGEPPDDAKATLASVKDKTSRDALCAEAYLALAADDPPAALDQAKQAQAAFEKDAETHYLVGRALLAEDDGKAAAAELAASIEIKPTPLAYIALGIAEAAQGKPDAATKDFDGALGLVANHPQATIERARVLAAANKLPAGGQHPEAELAALISDAKDAGPEGPLLSHAQLGWASLALAEVKLARGDDAGAKVALAAAGESRPLRDARFAEALVAALLGAGDLSGARAEAERAMQTWPARGIARVQLARIAVLEGKPDQALALLAQAGLAATRPDALSVRGQAHLLRGELDDAAKDLDEALAARPDDRAAQLARATIDLKKGNIRDAASRAEPLYKARPDPEVGVIYGAALRQLPNTDRSRARQVLEDASKSPKGRAAYLELARLYREDGKYADAADAYGLAIKFAPPKTIDAALELATLKFDMGDAATARDTIDGLRAEAPEDFTLAIECARIHTAVGDPDGAQKCVDAAAKLTAPANVKWRVGKERARVDLARRLPGPAAAELKKTIVAYPEDAELRLLLIDASLALDDSDTTNATLADVLKKFAGFPEADLAVGRVKLAFGLSPQAVEKFAAADATLTARGAPPRVIADARTWYGRAEYNNNDLAKAKQAFEDAAKLDPSAAEPQYQLGLLYYEQQQLAQARTQFEHTVQLNPNYADAYFYLGDCARQLKDPAKAREALTSYLRLAPKGDFAGEARRMLAGG